MTEKRDWLRRPVTSLCMLLGTGILSGFIIWSSGNVPRNSGGDMSYTVTIRHYGVDAREMERTTAVPLEDALSAITGVKHVLSSSEYSRVRVFVYFGGPGTGHYEAVREAAQRVYETLPRSAQRPEIVSSGSSRIPLWTAAVFPGGSPGAGGPAVGRLLERVVKPVLEGLEGAGEVEISGTGNTEIIIALNPEETVSRSLNAAGITRVLGMNDVILPGGIFRGEERDFLITVDGRYHDTVSLAAALIPLDTGTAIRLQDMALVYEQEREPDTISRLDGKEAAVISVMGGSGADPGKLSRRLAGELKKFSSLPLEFKVLSDRGAEEAAAYRSVLFAAIQGALAVALMTALLGSGKKRRPSPDKPGRELERPGIPGALVSAITVPLTGLISIALLSLLGIGMDRSLLAGLSVGIGTAVDALILSSERLGEARTAEEGRSALNRLRIPLISGSVTTIAALLPLGAMKSAAGDINALAWAVGAVTLVSMITALALLPPLFLWRREGTSLRRRPILRGLFPGGRWDRPVLRLRQVSRFLFSRLSRKAFRFLALSSRIASGRPRLVLSGALLLSAAGIAALFFAGVDVGTEASEDSVYLQIEFAGGFRAAEADKLLAPWAGALKAREEIKTVQTSARTSSASALVSFYPEKTTPEKVRELIRAAPIPGGFIYIPETSAGEQIREITVSGDDDNKCRELAEEAARLCQGLPLIRETVLNFKEGSPQLKLVPLRDRLEPAGISFSAAADTVRRGIHGPVAYKRTGTEGETDVRVRFSGSPVSGAGDIRGLPVLDGRKTTAPRIDSLMAEDGDREPSSIRREDRRRIASISIRTGALDPRTLKREVMARLGEMELPPGYSLEFDREAIRAAEALSGTAVYFLLALVFCYMVIAAVNESFTIPLAVLSVVPPSLAVPALFLVVSGYPINAAAACAFVAVSGMAVNAAVLTADEFRHSPAKAGAGSAGVYRIIRSRFPALLAAGGTTIAGALPFLFLREGSNRVVRILALVTGLGVAASCLCSLIMLPALAKISSKFFSAFEASSTQEP